MMPTERDVGAAVQVDKPTAVVVAESTTNQGPNGDGAGAFQVPQSSYQSTCVSDLCIQLVLSTCKITLACRWSAVASVNVQQRIQRALPGDTSAPCNCTTPPIQTPTLRAWGMHFCTLAICMRSLAPPRTTHHLRHHHHCVPQHRCHQPQRLAAEILLQAQLTHTHAVTHTLEPAHVPPPQALATACSSYPPRS